MTRHPATTGDKLIHILKPPLNPRLDPNGILSAHWCSTAFFSRSVLPCAARTKELSSKEYGKLGRSSNLMGVVTRFATWSDAQTFRFT